MAASRTGIAPLVNQRPGRGGCGFSLVFTYRNSLISGTVCALPRNERSAGVSPRNRVRPGHRSNLRRTAHRVPASPAVASVVTCPETSLRAASVYSTTWMPRRNVCTDRSLERRAQPAVGKVGYGWIPRRSRRGSPGTTGRRKWPAERIRWHCVNGGPNFQMLSGVSVHTTKTAASTSSTRTTSIGVRSPGRHPFAVHRSLQLASQFGVGGGIGQSSLE